jgi:hypothetical protein
MEARIARLESEVAQLRANLADVQADVRRQRLDRAIASPRHDIPLISCARVPRRKATWLRLTPVDVPWVLACGSRGHIARSHVDGLRLDLAAAPALRASARFESLRNPSGARAAG